MRSLAGCAAAAGLLLLTSSAAADVPRPESAYQPAKHVRHVRHVRAASAAALAWWQRRIDRHRSATWTAQDAMRQARTRTAHAEKGARSAKYLRWIARLWAERRQAAEASYRHPPHEAQWECIHRYEGSWTDPGSPYYGGLQMDVGFQQAYGPALYRAKGTADHWTPLEQMWVAERAWNESGFRRWPNTARMCGLL